VFKVMNRAEFIADLQSIVVTDRQRWKDAAFERAINAALRDLSDARPLSGSDSVMLQSGLAAYPVRDCVLDYKSSQWGQWPSLEPWDANWPGPSPRVFLSKNLAGKYLEFSPAPSAAQIRVYGSAFVYQYNVLHVLTDEDCTVADADSGLLRTRALAELMKELMTAGVTNSVQMNRGAPGGGAFAPNNGAPSTIYDALMRAYRESI
jgi:hypothetical protein